MKRRSFLTSMGTLGAASALAPELVLGRSLKEIASALNITVQTVWRHRDSLLRKMHVSNDVELARLATRCGYEGA